MVIPSKTLSSFIIFCVVVILNSSDVFSQWNGNGTDIHNTNSGNVGIGTTNTGSCKLAVEGTIGAREVIVTADTFPDYIFSKDYKLTPLYQVEDYIIKNQHLPGIPSSYEVKRNGISIGKMQQKLLEKIEELTLHMIALEKRNKILEARIEEMEKR